MLLKKYILSKKPRKYLKQGRSHCGVYSVKAILSSYGLDKKLHPEDYHPSWLGRLLGTTWGIDYYSNILIINGLKAKTKTAEKLKEQAHTLIKSGMYASFSDLVRDSLRKTIAQNEYDLWVEEAKQDMKEGKAKVLKSKKDIDEYIKNL